MKDTCKQTSQHRRAPRVELICTGRDQPKLRIRIFQQRLTVACDLVRYYQTVGRDLTAANIQWNQVMSNFEIQWKALKDRKDEDDPDVPTITKALPIIKWTEAFQDFLHRVIGARMIPLAYVIRIDPQVPGIAPTLAPNQPHSTEHGSVEEELIARASHTHALFRDDNSVVYYHLEKATRGTSYAASIKPFTKAKGGRGAWKALISQYAGKDKWEAEIKRQEQLLHTRIWKGQSNFSLENFISQHRNAYVSMQASAEHVQYQLPDRIPSTTPGAEPPRDARDSGSARSHSTHLETSSSNRP